MFGAFPFGATPLGGQPGRRRTARFAAGLSGFDPVLPSRLALLVDEQKRRKLRARRADSERVTGLL